MASKRASRLGAAPRQRGGILNKNHLPLAQNASAHERAKCEITRISAGWNESRAVDVTVEFQCTNLSDLAWETIEAKAYLIHPALGLIQEAETMIKAPARKTFSSTIAFEWIEPEVLNALAHCTVVVSGHGCTCVTQDVGTVEIPDDGPATTFTACPVDVGDAVRVVTAHVRMSEPDDDREVDLEVFALLQNRSDSFSRRVILAAEMVHPNGTDSFNRGGASLDPAEIYPATVYLDVPAFRTRAARVHLSVEVCSDEAVFTAQGHDIDISALGRIRTTKPKRKKTYPLEGRRVRVRFPMTKSDGEFPDLSLLPRAQRTKKYLATCLVFDPWFGKAEDDIESWRLVDDGLETFRARGYPDPVVEFVLKRKFTQSELEYFRTDVFACAYSLRIPGLYDAEAVDNFFYEDHNGYTEIIDVW